MLSAFGHLEGLGLAETSRNAHDDEYSDDESSSSSLAPPATLVWLSKSTNSETKGPVNVKELYISTELASASFLTCNFPSFEPVGSLSTESGMALSLLAPPGETLQQEGGLTKMIVVASNKKFNVAPGDEWQWVEPLFASVSATKIVVLGTVLATKVPLVSAAQGRPMAPLIFQLGTTTFLSSGRTMLNDTVVLDAPILPNPILMEGFSGAVMAHCEAVGLNAVSLISLIERVIDSTTLVAYEQWIESSGMDTKERRDLYKEAVKDASRQLDSMYL